MKLARRSLNTVPYSRFMGLNYDQTFYCKKGTYTHGMFYNHCVILRFDATFNINEKIMVRNKREERERERKRERERERERERAILLSNIYKTIYVIVV